MGSGAAGTRRPSGYHTPVLQKAPPPQGRRRLDKLDKLVSPYLQKTAGKLTSQWSFGLLTATENERWKQKKQHSTLSGAKERNILSVLTVR